jgi:hypothetical protein
MKNPNKPDTIGTTVKPKKTDVENTPNLSTSTYSCGFQYFSSNILKMVIPKSAKKITPKARNNTPNKNFVNEMSILIILNCQLIVIAQNLMARRHGAINSPTG